jgi:hypothetical protein|tara:strand:- start:1743 stop:1910 length:168 start_codon:yes stop_codon:yes gene_type:complete
VQTPGDVKGTRMIEAMFTSRGNLTLHLEDFSRFLEPANERAGNLFQREISTVYKS